MMHSEAIANAINTIIALRQPQGFRMMQLGASVHWNNEGEHAMPHVKAEAQDEAHIIVTVTHSALFRQVCVFPADSFTLTSWGIMSLTARKGEQDEAEFVVYI